MYVTLYFFNHSTLTMLYYYVSVAYTWVNILLAGVLLYYSRKTILTRFYFFCITCLTLLGVCTQIIITSQTDLSYHLYLKIIIEFLYSLMPFFFIHFVIIFIRRYDLLKTKSVIILNYSAGLISYAGVFGGYLPQPISNDGTITAMAYVFYVTWMSIFFSIGITMLFSNLRGFSERKLRSNLLLSGFALLLLVLPSPFTTTISSLFFENNFEWYGVTSAFGLLIAIYLLFRHKIVITVYDSLRAALGVMNDIFLMTDEMFRIEVARGGLTSSLGYKESEIIGSSIEDLINEKEYIETYLQYVKTGKMTECQFDAEVNSKDGEKRTMNFSLSPVIENEQIAGFVGIVRDITERKRMENALRDREERFRNLVENINEGFYITDATGKFTYASPSIYISTGFTPEEFIGRSYLRLITPEDRRRVVTFYHQQRIEKKLDSTCEFRILTKDGRTIWSEQRTRIIRDQTNTIIEYRCVIRDISERKQAEEQIRLLASALESASEIISITDSNDRFIYVNKAFLQAYQYSLKEIIGNHPSLLYTVKNNDPSVQSIMKQARAGGWSGELMHRTKQGVEFPVFMSTSQIHDDKGSIFGLVNVSRDITHQKQLEEELRQSQKLESIGTLAGGIAHDFNNILSIILAYTSSLARSQHDPEKLTSTIATIKQAVQRGTGIVRALLLIAQKSEAKFESINMNLVISDFVMLLKDTFPKTISFSLDLSPELPLTLADLNQVQQTLLNLCVNARDAMPQGGTLTFKTNLVQGKALRDRNHDLAEQQYVLISVKDSGEGIPLEVQKNIFDPFFTTKEKGKGTGLGLSVVYGTVKRHRGFIDLISAPGQGTTFQIYFPVISQSGIQEDATPTDQETIRGGTETLLLVEDEPPLLDLIKFSLESLGYKVLTASDGIQAVQHYKQFYRDIAGVISDMGLPKLDGWNAFLRMKEINPGVKIIFASGFMDVNSQTELQELGAKGFIQKPYDPDDVGRKVREMLDSK